jgi:hypothetical protein
MKGLRVSFPERRQSRQTGRVWDKSLSFFPQAQHFFPSRSSALFRTNPSLRDFINDVVLPHATRHFDPDIGARSCLLNILVLNLHGIHSLSDIGGMANNVDLIPTFKEPSDNRIAATLIFPKNLITSPIFFSSIFFLL